MDDAIHALFANEAKRFLRDCCGIVNLRIRARAQAPPIGAGSAGQWRSGGVLGRSRTDLPQICGRWSAHRWTQEGGGIRQICRFPDGGRERPWRCQLATPRCKARLAAPVITFGKFAEGQSRASPEGKSCQLAWFRWWPAVSPVAMACPRDANLHLCACCLKSANWRICGQGRIRPAVGKGANLRNCSISVVPVITCRPR